MKLAAAGLMLKVEGARMAAVFEAGRLVELRDKKTRDVLVRAKPDVPALELIHEDGNARGVGDGRWAECRLEMLGGGAAQYWISDWEADACIRISTDDDSGELVVEPSVTAARDGVAALRWNLTGLRKDLLLVAPFFQGTRLPLEDSFVANRDWNWPSGWEAAIAILEGKKGSGFYCTTLDRDFRYKSLRVGHPRDPRTLGLDTENYGPWEGKKEAGGLAWRVGLFDKGWQTAAERYRLWLWEAYPLEEAAARRPEWAADVSLAISWCPCKMEILDALAKRHPPGRTLLHVPSWRSDGYDQNYPEYNPSDEGRGFIGRALAMGFRVMPHFNYFAVDPSHPIYAELADYHLRELRTRRLMGWSWVDDRWVGNPQSHSGLPRHRDRNVMAYIHAGASRWRRELASRVARAVEQLDIDSVFVDQTLCTYNCVNALVEGMSSTEGMWHLTRELTEIGPGLSVSGEGLNEISMQWQTFAQAHLFQSWHATAEGLERVPCPVGEFLYGDLCRTIGYCNLHGQDETSALRMRVHAQLGAIPTLTIGSAEAILKPNAAVKEELERAASL